MAQGYRLVHHAHRIGTHTKTKAEAEAEAEEAWGGVVVYPAIWSKGRGNTAEANRMEKVEQRNLLPKERPAVEYLKLEVSKSVLGIPVALAGFGCGSFQKRMIGGVFLAL